MIDPAVVTRSWKRLVFGHPAYEGGAVNRHAYTFCVLEQFYRHLKRREIHADASTRWRNPQAQLLEGEPWEAVRGDVLTTLGLLDNPEVLLADHTRTLDAAYREVGGRLAVNTEVRVDDAGKIHLTGVKAVEEPPSLVDLRADYRDAATRGPAGSDLGGDVVGAAAGGGLHRRVGWPVPAERPRGVDRGVPGRAFHECGVPADRQEGRARAGALTVVARVPELLPARDDRGGERAAGGPPGRAASGPVLGRRPGRRPSTGPD